MTEAPSFEIFLQGPPGLEHTLLQETHALGYAGAVAVSGGVVVQGDWPDVWRLNLWCRGASRILVRIAQFRVTHLAQLDKRARALPWTDLLAPETAIKVEATTKRSKIYHSGAAAERVLNAALAAGAVAAEGNVPTIQIACRIEDNLCTLSIDSCGELLHRRGFKQAVGKAPLRETLAAMFLRECSYAPGEALVDPFCGSGTIPIEAAEISAGLAPGRARAFAFERLASFDQHQWTDMKNELKAEPEQATPIAFGSDRLAGAIEMSNANAARAGVDGLIQFTQHPVSVVAPAEGVPPGLVLTNPPYGARIGDKGQLTALYQAFGQTMRARFGGWRVGLITSEGRLAKATGLPFEEVGPPVPHGPLKIRLYRTAPL